MIIQNRFLRNKSLPEITFRRSPEPTNKSAFESFHSHLTNSKLEADKSNFYSQGQNQKKPTLSSLLAGSLPNYDSVKVNKGSIKLGDIPGNVFSTRQPNQISARQKSEKKIVRAREKAREATFNQWEKIFELKETLSIYKANEGTVTFPNRKHVQKILECLESLNSEDNELGDLMMLVIKVLNTTTYIDWHFSEFIIKKLGDIESKELCKGIFQAYREYNFDPSESSSKQFF